ncbi:hypothetical protein ACQKWADRAFT_130324 [Trichoderma austrokoningii]
MLQWFQPPGSVSTQYKPRTRSLQPRKESAMAHPNVLDTRRRILERQSTRAINQSINPRPSFVDRCIGGIVHRVLSASFLGKPPPRTCACSRLLDPTGSCSHNSGVTMGSPKKKNQ